MIISCLCIDAQKNVVWRPVVVESVTDKRRVVIPGFDVNNVDILDDWIGKDKIRYIFVKEIDRDIRTVVSIREERTDKPGSSLTALVFLSNGCIVVESEVNDSDTRESSQPL